MNAKIILVLAFVSSFYIGESQTQMLRSISIGQQIPDLGLNNIKNYHRSNAKLSDFEGKMLILDFWNKGCNACIRAFPKMEHLQDLFRNQIQVLLVAPNTEKEVEFLFKNSPIVKSTKLPFVLGDTILHSYFNHNINPYYVILDSVRRVVGITSSENMTKENIEAMLSGEKLNRIRKELIDFDPEKPLLLEGNGRQLKYLEYYSVLMRYIEEYNHGRIMSVFDSVGKQIGIRAFNTTIPNLYTYAYGKLLSNHITRGTYKVFVEASNKSRFFPPEDLNKFEEWQLANSYSYELKVPDAGIVNQHKYMQIDLDRFLMLKSRVIDSLIDCIILYRTSNNDKIRTKGEVMINNERTKDGILINRNVPISVITGNLKRALTRPEDPPIIDETGYSGNIDITLHTKFQDMDEVSEELRKYDLAIKKEKRLVGCLILTEK